MVNRIFQKTGEKVSLLGFGAMRLPTGEDGKIEPVQAQKMVDLAYENGVNYFDTAYMYHDGESQSFLGQALKKYDRHTYFITNKLPLWMCDSSADMERIFNDQLKRCGVDYFDFYLVHAMDAQRLKRAIEWKTFDFLREKQAEGKIHNIGFSFHDTPDVLEDICKANTWDFAQIQLNYLDWEYQDAKQQYEILCRHHLPCIVMEPVRGGALANLPKEAATLLKAYAPDKSIASWAIKYAASLPNVLTVLSGMSLEEQVLDNLDTMNQFVPLTEEEQDLIQQALAIYKQNTLIPCTKCKYCIDCPVSVNIPEVFRVYNDYKVTGHTEDFKNEMKALADRDGSQCVECGACMEKCPQKIRIPEELQKIHAVLAEVTK